MGTVPVKYQELFDIAAKAFPGKVEYVEEYDLSQLTTARVVQVRAAKNRAPEKMAREYGQKMARGVEFPPGVVTNGANPWIVDGSTRFKGREFAKHTTAPMIVIQVDAEKASAQIQNTLIVLGSRYNQKNGKPLEAADIEIQSTAYIDLGMSSADIAKELGISDSMVNSFRNRLYADRRMVDLGIFSNVEEVPEAIKSVSVREVLGNGNSRALHDDPFRMLVHFAVEKQANKGEIAGAAKAALSASSDEEAVKIIEEMVRSHPGNSRSIKADNIPDSVTLRKVIAEMVKLANAIERDPELWQAHEDALAEGSKYLAAVRRNQNHYMESND